jgi:NAD+ diphosphatase
MSDRDRRGLSARRLAFSGAGLDRAAAERRDPDWLAARRAQAEARSLVLSDRGVWLSEGRLLLTAPNGDSLFLGLDDRGPLFALDATGAEPKEGRPAGLREAATELSAAEAALSAYAASLLSWHRRHRFCANCGEPTEIADAGHQRDCATCRASHFPRTDPVVIVQVTDAAGRLLLGRQERWPPGRFSVLAGFVEPGETLEEAVRREVREESGVAVDEVSYVASQPWPFPSSLMIGFRAAATAGSEPQPGDEELSEVRWFERSEVEAAASGTGAVALPPPYSISRRLIDEWLSRDRGDPDRSRRSS